MTSRAVGAIFAVVFVLVAGNALIWRSLIAVLMTFFTINFGMFTHEGETGLVVIEIRLAPAVGRMAGGAIRAELTVMLVVRGVAGVTIGRRS